MSQAEAQARGTRRETPAPSPLPAATLSDPPTLASLAAWAAVFSVVINRGLLRSVGDALSRTDLLLLRRLASLPQNLAALLAAAALALAVQELLSPRTSCGLWRRPSSASAFARAGISGFAGIFLASIALALFRPASETSGGLVLMSVISGLLLAILVGLAALRIPAATRTKSPLGVATLGAMAAFSGLVLSTIGGVLHSHPLARAAGALRQIGEIAYLVLPFAMWAAIPRARSGGGPPRRWTLVISAMIGLGWALSAWKRALAADFANVFYGTTHLELFVERAPLAYALPLGLGLGLATEAQLRQPTRQAGAALLCLLAAGVAPRSPEQALYLTLGLVLLARWTISANPLNPHESRLRIFTPLVK